MQVLKKRWAPLILASGLALLTYALAATHGYAWQMIWLPAAVAGAAWPRPTQPASERCRHRLRRMLAGR